MFAKLWVSAAGVLMAMPAYALDLCNENVSEPSADDFALSGDAAPVEGVWIGTYNNSRCVALVVRPNIVGDPEVIYIVGAYRGEPGAVRLISAPVFEGDAVKFGLPNTAALMFRRNGSTIDASYVWHGSTRPLILQGSLSKQ